MLRYAIIFLLLPFTSASALVVDAPLADMKQELRAQAMFHQFRCVVCQSESVADSPADVARDVRATIRRLVSEDKSDAEIEAMLIASYGEFVLMKPEFSKENMPLWLAPLVILVLGAGFLFRAFRKK